MQNDLNKYRYMPVTQTFPVELIDAARKVERCRGGGFYISGGTLRDWLLGRPPADLDITVADGAVESCKELLRLLKGGTFVQLGTDTEEAARVVWRGANIDFSNFRKGAQSIEEELHYRDFTINAMAIELAHEEGISLNRIIDPLGGLKDLENGLLHCCPDAFSDDPLRMLRGYRLQAELGFAMSPGCKNQIRCHCQKIQRSAAERVLYELDRIMDTTVASEVILEMSKSGVLWQIIPELKEGVGVEQPGYHHEDVFNHSLLALKSIDKVIAQPHNYFGKHKRVVIEYLSDYKRRKELRWSALFHDLGKPATFSSGTIKSGRVTFYNHDRIGSDIFKEIAARLRMSGGLTEMVSKLVEMHMHPFHLSNVSKDTKLSRRALLKICKKAGDQLAGLFVLAMADSLAGLGELKPKDMEQQLCLLFDEVWEANEKLIQPALYGERLVTGYDLINEFNLKPGPLFSKIFTELEVARVEGDVMTREDAFKWLVRYLRLPSGGDNKPG